MESIINLFVHLNFIMNDTIIIIEVDVVKITGVVSIGLNIYLMLVFIINGSQIILLLEVFNYILSFR